MSLKKQYELKEFIAARMMTQKEAAKAIGCSDRQLRRVMNGESPAGFRLRKKLAVWGKGKIDLAKLAMIEKGR